MGFDTPIFFLLVAAAVGVLILGGLVLSIVLLLSERTRVVGIVLLALMLLGPAVGVAGMAFLWALHSADVTVESVVADPPSIEFRVPDEPQRLAPLPAGAELGDEPEVPDDAHQSEPTEPIPDAHQSDPELTDTEPGADAQSGRPFPGSTHRRVNT